MAAELIWTEEALDDIDAIAEFIARDSPHHAHRVMATLFDLGDEAGEQPLIGRSGTATAEAPRALPL